MSTPKHRFHLVGNPNAGKSLLFNALTGRDAKVANFPGVTVEFSKGSLLGHPEIELLDLPGIYSLSSRSKDEQVTTDSIIQTIADCDQHDAIIAVVDATQLKKSLFLVSELKQTGRLSGMILTMADLARPRLSKFDIGQLAQRIGVPVFLVSAVSKEGLKDLNDFFSTYTHSASPSIQEHPIFSPSQNIHFHHETVGKWLKDLKFGASVSRQITQKVDQLALHPFFGPLVLILVFSLLFQGLFFGSKPLVSLIDDMNGQLATFVRSLFEKDSLLGSLLADGVVGGVGSVLAFVPLIAFLFLFLGALEDSGYMARAVFLLHRIMSRVGLSGRAFVPLVSGFSCAVPAILSTRIIESRPERLTAILVTPLVSCSARLPIYGLLIAASFSQLAPLWGIVDVGALVMVSLYIFGIVAAFLVAAILRKGFIKGASAPLIMELPDYRWPRPRSLWRSVKSRVKLFLKEAGTVILAITIVLWALFTFPLEQPSQDRAIIQASVVEDLPFGEISTTHLENSYAGRLGHLIEPLIEPLGFNWKIGIGLIASFAAREVFIATFGVIYGLAGTEDSPSSLVKAIREDVNPKTGAPVYSPLVALSLLVFFAISLQCMSTVAVTRKETGSWRWPLIQIGYLNSLAWLLSFTIFQTGSALGF